MILLDDAYHADPRVLEASRLGNELLMKNGNKAFKSCHHLQVCPANIDSSISVLREKFDKIFRGIVG